MEQLPTKRVIAQRRVGIDEQPEMQAQVGLLFRVSLRLGVETADLRGREQTLRELAPVRGFVGQELREPRRVNDDRRASQIASILGIIRLVVFDADVEGIFFAAPSQPDLEVRVLPHRPSRM